MLEPILTLRGITKRFGNVTALADVDLEVIPGEVHAVLGENGAGKTTLMRVIYGLLTPDAGTMWLRGAPVRFASALDARRDGIGMVHQEFALVDALSVAENLVLSLCPDSGVLWRRDEVAARAERSAAEIGLELVGDLDTPVGELPVGVRQRIEIIKALAGEARILILDEPTAVLTPHEVEQLFAVLDRLRRAGTAVLFITHKLGEVLAIADRITVMRAGHIVARVPRAQVDAAELARLMIGAPAPAPPPLPPPPDARARLELMHVSTRAEPGRLALDDVSLAARAGEILGIGGVDGNGQAELFEVLLGARQPVSGTVAVDGLPIGDFAPDIMISAGIAGVPPDRQRQGVVPAMSVRENAALSVQLLRSLASGLLLRPAAQRAAAQAMVAAHAIKIGSLEDPVRTLSGGNVQKLVVARALAHQPQVLVAANPTRGLDIAAARTVHAAMRAALVRGAAIVLISSDLDEIVAHAHRVAVLYRGRLSAAVERPFVLDRIGALMAGRDAALSA